MYFSWLEYHPDKMRVGGSSPPSPTKLKIMKDKILKIVIPVKGHKSIILFMYEKEYIKYNNWCIEAEKKLKEKIWRIKK